MPAAANLTNLKMTTPDAAPAAAPGAPELFAALVAAIGSAPEGEAPNGMAVEGESETAPVSEQPESEAADQAAILLPMLDQQRAATPVPVAIAASAGPRQAIAPATTELATPHVASRGADAPVKAEAPREAAPQISPDATARTGADAPAVKNVVDEKPSAPVKANGATAGETAPVAPQKGREAASPSIPPAAPPPAPPQASQQLAQAQASIPAPLAARILAKPSGRPDTASPPAVPNDIAATGAPDIRAAASTPPIAPAAAAGLTDALQERTAADQGAAGQSGRGNEAPAPFATNLPTAPGTTAAAAAPAPNVGAAIAAQVLDLAKGGEWINEIARDIARSASTDGAMRFRLAPETLGELRVEITHSERGAHVRLQVTSEAAQQALAEAQPKLVQEARAQGVRIAEAEVSLSGGQSQGRDASRQAPPEQPMRSLRTAATNQASSGDRSEPAGRGRTDLYA